MHNTINTNTNFNGAFRLKPNELEAKKTIPTLLTKGKQVFYDMLEKGDEVIVVRDNYDKRIGKFIKDNNVIGVEYYPQISTKSGLDEQEPYSLLKLLHDKTTVVITDINEMFNAIAGQKLIFKTPKASKEVKKVACTLRLNIENPQLSSSKASTIIRDEEKKRTIEIIMKDKGCSYVYLKPDLLYGESIRCIIDAKGNIIKKFETPDEILKFNKRFKKLKSEEVNILQ